MSDEPETPNPQQTPTRQTQHQEIDSNLEFTPIGSTLDLNHQPQPVLNFDMAQRNTRMSDMAQQRLPKKDHDYSSRITSQQNTEMLRNIRKNAKPLHRTRIDNNGYESASSNSEFGGEDDHDENRYTGGMGSDQIIRTGLFGRGFIRDGTNVLPSFDNEKISERVELNGEESNMVKKQAELLQQLKAENMNLRVELRTLNSLPTDQSKLAEQIVQLNHQLILLKEQNDELKRGNDIDKESTDDAEVLKRHLDDLELQLQDKNQQYQDVRDEKDDLIQEKLRMTDEIQILNNKIDQYEFKLRDTNRQDQDSERISQLESDIRRMENTIDQLDKEVNDLTDENHKLNTDLDKLEQELDQRDTNNDVDDHVAEFKKEMQSKIDDLNEALDIREAEIENLRNDQKTLKHEKSQLELKMDVLEAKQATNNESQGTNGKRIEELTNRLVEASESIDQMDMEIENKDKIIENLSSNVKQLNSRVDTLMQEKRKLDSIVKEMETQLQGFSTEDSELIHLKLKKSQRDNDQLRETIDELIEKLKASRLGSSKDSIERELERANEKLDREISYRKEIESKLLNGDPELSYEDIENLRNKIEVERESFEQEIVKMTEIIKTLAEERDDALKDLDKLDEEKMDLIDDFEIIQREHQNIKKFENEKNQIIDSLKQDLEKLSIEYKMELDSHDTTRKLLMSQIDQLKDSIETKNQRIIKLETELAYTMREAKDDKESSVLIDELSLKVKELVKERNELKENKYKLGEELSSVINERDQWKFKMQTQSNNLKDLEKDVSRLINERKKLQKKLNVTNNNNNIDDLSDAIDKLKIQSSHISSGVEKIISKESQILANNLKVVDSVNESKNEVVLMRKQLEQTYKDYNDLRETLLRKIESVREERDEAKMMLEHSTKTDLNLSQKLEKKIKALENAIKIEKQEKLELLNRLQRETSINSFPTPESPSKNSEKVIKRLQYDIEICELQKQLLSLKLQETCDKYDDQRYQNKYFQAEIDTKNETIQRTYRLIRESGIDVSFKDKLTQFSGRSKLRIAFLLVLAGVRMRRRLEDAKERKNQIHALKKEIIKKRYLVEKV